jgi:serine/threonine protein kinase
LNELELVTEALNRTDPAERAAFLDEACAGNPGLRRRIEGLLASLARSHSPLDRPPLAPEVFAETSALVAGECRLDEGMATLARADSNATTDVNSEADSPPMDAPEEVQLDGASATIDRSDSDPTAPGALNAGIPRAGRITTGNEIGKDIAGRYRLVDLIGEGGMGSVYLAEQSEPVKRQVALKLIKTGMDSRGVLARFDAERQALALMDHPNIARIYDGGVTPSGQPFFVMELVNGVPLAEYCDQKRLSVNARLELFTAVCQAVQHAHQKGIIHRDLKPGNVLVTEVDGKPTPKVIDFGVAKATEVKLTDMSFADIGAIVGTPTYMSPEQADPTSMDIDTRTDVYALGVMLYELLTGTTPIDASQFKRGALLEMLRMVREVDPPRPSTRLSTADALPNIAANRGIEPARLSKLMQSELDWVVMKALEKDRNRRYETANGFARDIQRYLADEVVEARPPSRGYRLKKFVKRNKIQVIAASLVFLALVGGIVGTSVGLLQARKARQEEAKRAEGERLAKLDAQEKELLAVAATEKERTARLEEERQRKFAEAISRFVQDDFLALTSVEGQDRFGGEGKDALNKDSTVRQLLDRAAEKLRARKDLDPRIEAELCWIIGVNYRGAGDARKAIPFLERAVKLRGDLLGRDHAYTLTAMNSLGVAYDVAGKIDMSVPLYKEIVELEKATLGPDHPSTLDTLTNLATAYQDAGELDLALSLNVETLELKKAKFGPDYPSTLITMSNLGRAYQAVGKPDLAVPLLEETVKLMEAKLGPDHPNTLVTKTNLALAYQAAGNPERALPLLENTLKRQIVKLGPDHPGTLVSMFGLAQAYREVGKLDLAAPLLDETLKRMRATLGPEHPHTITSMGERAAAYQDAGKLDLALPLFEETLKLSKVNRGPEHPYTLIDMDRLAGAYQTAGKIDLAVPLLEETLKLSTAKLGPDHPDTLARMNNLALAYAPAGKPDLALPLSEELLKLTKAKHGSAHPATLSAMNNLATVYWFGKQLDRSIPLFEETLRGREANLGRNHLDTLTTVMNLGINYKDARRFKESIPLLEEAHRAAKKYPRFSWVGEPLLDAYGKSGESAKLVSLLQELSAEARRTLPKDSPQLARQLATLGTSSIEGKAFVESEPILRECLAIREKTQPDDWKTFNTKSQLGGALLGQRKYTEAEPLLLAGYEGMKLREKTIPPVGATRIPEALERLVQFYEATNKPDEAAKWQAERAKYPPAQPPLPPGEKK